MGTIFMNSENSKTSDPLKTITKSYIQNRLKKKRCFIKP